MRTGKMLLAVAVLLFSGCASIPTKGIDHDNATIAITSNSLPGRTNQPAVRESVTNPKDNSTKQTVVKYIISKQPKLNLNTATSIVKRTVMNSVKYGIDVWLMFALMETESRYNPTAVNPNDGSTGLMQIMSITKSGKVIWLSELKQRGYIKQTNDLLDPIINIDAGSYILNKYMSDSKTPEEALWKYNGRQNKKKFGVYMGIINEKKNRLSTMSLNVEF